MSTDHWVTCTVADVAAPVKNALVGGPFGSNLVSRDYVGFGIPVIRGQNMGYGRWVDGEFVYVSSSKAEELSANTARPDDLVFTQRGTLGQVAIVPHHGFDRYIVSQSQMKLTVDAQKANVLFLYYYFNSEEQQAYILRNAIQTGVPHTNLEHLRTTPLRLPPLSEQRAITQILGTLDDKIELNRRMNETLEAMARAIFKSWFVDFDPVRAKSEGRQPAGVDAETTALFPDSFEDSPLGKIPKGWKAGVLGEIADIVMGQSPPGETYNETGNGLPFYQGIRDYGFRFPSHRVYCTAPTRFAEKGDVLLSVRAPVGSLNVAIEHCSIGRGVAALRLKAEHGGFLYYLLKATQSDWEKFEAEGTVFGSVSKSDVHDFKVIVPPHDLLEQFGAFVEPTDARIESNERENQTLAAIRDALLPKLLSGEVRVKGAEKIMGAVT